MLLSFKRLKQIFPIVLIILVAILVSTYKDRFLSSVNSSIEEKSDSFIGNMVKGIYENTFNVNENEGNDNENDADNEGEENNEDEESKWVIVISEDGTYAVKAEIADSQEERARGLMYRDELCEDCGMLFIFEEDSIDGFWMKNCEIPLDLIFIDEDGVIVDIKENFEPCEEDPCPSYKPGTSYRYVLEVSGMIVDEYSVKIGDTVDIPEE